MKKQENTKPECCGLESLKKADDCPNGLGCLTGVGCNFKREKKSKVNTIHKLKQKRNPEQKFSPNKRKKKKKR